MNRVWNRNPEFHNQFSCRPKNINGTKYSIVTNEWSLFCLQESRERKGMQRGPCYSLLLLEQRIKPKIVDQSSVEEVA